MDNIWILAQTNGDLLGEDVDISSQGQTGTLENGGQDNTETVTPNDTFMGRYGSLILLCVMFFLMYTVLLRGPRKKQQEHKEMVQALAKNDKVRTIGGILGTIVDIKGDEITLKIDESNNTKIKIISSAISGKITKE